jgi:outer membrane immunogenic protein
MKALFLSSAATLVLTAGSQAADLTTYEPVEAPAIVAPVPEFAWTGFYVGVQGGYAFGNDEDDELEFDTDGDGDFDDTVFVGGADAFPDFESESDNGFTAGVKLGYDQQFGSFVLGGVVDLNYLDLEEETTGTSVTPADYTFHRELDWLATARLRAGVAFDRVLVYGTGGFAYGGIDQSFSTDSGANLVGGDDNGELPPDRRQSLDGDDDNAWGYTVGAGVEALVTERVSVGLEYLYTSLDADQQTVTFDSGPFAAGPGGETDIRSTGDDNFDFHTVRATASFRF